MRELLKLAKDYYSTTDDGVFKRWIHALKVAGKQIAERPAFLKDLVQSFRLDALCLFDEKRILISKELPEPKQRWAEGHEIGHRLSRASFLASAFRITADVIVDNPHLRSAANHLSHTCILKPRKTAHIWHTRGHG